MEPLNSVAVKEKMDLVARKILNQDGLDMYARFIKDKQFNQAYQLLLMVLDALVLANVISDEKAIKLYDLFPYTTEVVDKIRNNYISISNHQIFH